MTIAGWRHFNHVADVQIRGAAATLAEVFEQAALALTAVGAQLEVVEPRLSIDFNAENSNRELLFFDWPNSVVYAMARRKVLFSRC